MAADGIMLVAGDGERIPGVNATLKAAQGPGTGASSFEVIVPPGYDVGAHVHSQGEEVFFVLEGELDIMAFQPADSTPPDWHAWVSASGQRFLRGGPGAFMHVPAGTPHAFANPTDQDTRMFFQSSVPGGHENYFRELAAILGRGGAADPGEIARLRERYDIIQLTALRPGRAS